MAYTLSPADQAYLDQTFAFVEPSVDQAKRINELRALARGFAVALLTHCPPGRERAAALSRLEEAAMWANKAISREAPA